VVHEVGIPLNCGMVRLGVSPHGFGISDPRSSDWRRGEPYAGRLVGGNHLRLTVGPPASHRGLGTIRSLQFRLVFDGFIG
jgi:hypothetical protein